MANIIDPAQLSDEELQAQMDQFEQEDQQLEPETVPAPAEEPKEEAPPGIEIDGQQYTLDEIRSGMMRHQDYTRKTTELAEKRKQFEPMFELFEHWQNNPAARPLIVEALQKEAGITGQVAGQASQAPSTPGLLGQYNPALSDPEWEQRGYASMTEMLIHQQVLESNRTTLEAIGQMRQHLGNEVQAKERDLAATNAAKSIMQEYGVTGVTGEAVKDAMIQTGINDPEAAFFKVHGKRLIEAAKGQAPRAETPKPSSPSPEGANRFFDPNDPDLTGGKIMRLLEQGYQPLPE